jgi:23S rRNA (cytidine1920-2'-O)/16S rRNA (cytidine1409-2'-O)-methyltransferase
MAKGAKPAKVPVIQLLIERSLAPDERTAEALIRRGLVKVEGAVCASPGRLVRAEYDIAVKPLPRFVSRGGDKLDGFLAEIGFDVAGAVVADIGASTGGFTDCLLKHGAERVYAVDVARGFLDGSLVGDPRVVQLDGVNARNLSPTHIPEVLDGAVIDVSFISLALVIPAVAPLVKQGGWIVPLVKPQFEREKGDRRAFAKGVVRDSSVHRDVLTRVLTLAQTEWGLAVNAVSASEVRGARGNVEFFALLVKDGRRMGAPRLAYLIEQALSSLPQRGH